MYSIHVRCKIRRNLYNLFQTLYKPRILRVDYQQQLLNIYHRSVLYPPLVPITIQPTHNNIQ